MAMRASQVLAASRPVLTLDNINPLLRKMEYAVRGRIVSEQNEIDKQLQTAQGREAFPFAHTIQCNIGNPQALKQKPLTYNRQVLSLFANPELLTRQDISNIYPDDVIDRAQYILSHTGNSNGAYTGSKGFEFVRQHVADFISERDGVKANPEHIFLTDGASQGVAMMLRTMVRGKQDGIMIPIPQYPLYSATLDALDGTRVSYFLDEENGWALDMDELQRSFDEAKGKGGEGFSVRALVVINPGNPTGAVLTAENIRRCIEFAHRNSMVIMADEVYQENVYDSDTPFVSFRKVLNEMGEKYADQELVSFHSTSKGIQGECGLRGGYMELVGFLPEVVDQVYKMASVNLCPNVFGQIAVDLMVKRPVKGSQSYAQWKSEYTAIYDSLMRRAQRVVKALNEMEGVKCNPVEGAMYVFPRITLPDGAKAAAKEKGVAPDMLYCLEALHATGVTLVPGSGFGQKEGTHHFRGTFLPPEEEIDQVCQRLKKFHADFLKKYSSSSSSSATGTAPAASS